MNADVVDSSVGLARADEELCRLITATLSVEQIEAVYARAELSSAMTLWLRELLVDKGRMKSDNAARTMKKWIEFSVTTFGALIVMGIVRMLVSVKFVAVLAGAAVMGFAWKRLRAKPGDPAFAPEEPKRPRKPTPGDIAQIKAKVGRGGYTHLMCAAQIWDSEALRVEIEKDPSCVNQADEKGSTPLAYAVNADFVEGVRLLLENGARVELDANAEGKPAIRYVKSDETLGLLLAYAPKGDSK